MDEDIFENAPRVDADILYTDKKRCIFKNIRIRVDGAIISQTILCCIYGVMDNFLVSCAAWALSSLP